MIAWSVEINGKRWKGVSASMAQAEADIAWLRSELAAKASGSPPPAP